MVDRIIPPQHPAMTLLTPEQIEEITGCQRPSTQIRVLRRHRIFHLVDRNGCPKLTWHHLNHPVDFDRQEYAEPDYSSLEAMI